MQGLRTEIPEEIKTQNVLTLNQACVTCEVMPQKKTIPDVDGNWWGELLAYPRCSIEDTEHFKMAWKLDHVAQSRFRIDGGILSCGTQTRTF